MTETWTDAELDVLVWLMAATTGVACIFLTLFTVWWWALLLPLVCAVKAAQAWRRAVPKQRATDV